MHDFIRIRVRFCTMHIYLYDVHLRKRNVKINSECDNLEGRKIEKYEEIGFVEHQANNLFNSRTAPGKVTKVEIKKFPKKF